MARGVFTQAPGRADGRNEPATGPQRIAITRMAKALRIRRTIEEGPMTKGQAGTLISELAAELRKDKNES